MRENNYITTAEILESLGESFGLSDKETVMNELKTMESPRDFGSYATVPTLKNDTFGLISLSDFFDRLEDMGTFLTMDEVKDLFEQYPNDWIDHQGDNSYNYNGYLEREINFESFENEDDYLVFIAVHIGLDVRSGYTEYFPIRFDSRYDWEEVAFSTFELAYFEYDDENGERQSVSVDGEAFSDTSRLYFHENDKDWDGYFDCSDKETATESMKEVMKELDISFQPDSLEVSK